MIGENIAVLRKERGYTQEQLARMVGVTAQAVSKWENGGTPDAELLPSIADRLGVTIDTLFGRSREQTESMEQILVRWLSDIPKQDRFWKLFCALARIFQHVCAWEDSEEIFSFVKATLGTVPTKSCYWTSDALKDKGKMWARSVLDMEEGLQLGILSEDCPMYLLMPKPKCGYEANFAENKGYRLLFETLALPGSLELLRCFYGRKYNYYTAAAAADYAGIGQEDAVKALEAMEQCNLLEKKQVEVERGQVDVYTLHNNSAFVPFMLLAKWFMEKEDVWLISWDDQRTPVLAVPDKEENG